MCGTEIVDGNRDTLAFPSEDKLVEIGKKNNQIPFAYSRPLLPEESSIEASTGSGWNPLGSDDYYPTIKATLGNVALQDDFDTGASCTLVSDGLVKKEHLNFWMSHVHLGTPYKYFAKRHPVHLWDSRGTTQTSEVMIHVVEDWDHSPFVEINQNRRVLFGRDLLRAFKVEVLMDSVNRVTLVRFAGDETPFRSSKSSSNE